MKIPWKKLAKDPILVTISEVYVIVSPNTGKWNNNSYYKITLIVNRS